MTVTYFFRRKTVLVSIEIVFESIFSALPKDVIFKKVYCRYRRGIWGYVYNMLEAWRRQTELNHITGDVHYLALFLKKRRTILTIHDCGTLRTLQGWRREVARLFWFEWPVRRAAVVTVISEATRRELLSLTSCPPSKVNVIPDPLPPHFRPYPQPHNHGAPRLLQLGTRPNKNLDRLAAALDGLSCHLTIIGSLSEEQKTLLKGHCVSYDAISDLSDEEVLLHYRQAEIVLFCSTYEGFGLPVIEAQAVGRVVVASDIEPIREVTGGAACLVDPHSVDSIRQGILRVVGDRAYREELIRRGFENVQRFDAHRIASTYRDLYLRMLAA